MRNGSLWSNVQFWRKNKLSTNLISRNKASESTQLRVQQGCFFFFIIISQLRLELKISQVCYFMHLQICKFSVRLKRNKHRDDLSFLLELTLLTRSLIVHNFEKSTRREGGDLRNTTPPTLSLITHKTHITRSNQPQATVTNC